MAVQRTLSIIKPDAVKQGKQGVIAQRLLDEGFKIVAMRQLRLTLAQAQGFYAVHRERPFFGELTAFMSRGPILVMALERDNAVEHYRKVIGATDPAKADEGTIRKLYGTNVQENAVHGSDSVENGVLECAYYFAGLDLL
jgi:nucleoside-diphosphate kinase